MVSSCINKFNWIGNQKRVESLADIYAAANVVNCSPRCQAAILKMIMKYKKVQMQYNCVF